MIVPILGTFNGSFGPGANPGFALDVRFSESRASFYSVLLREL